MRVSVFFTYNCKGLVRFLEKNRLLYKLWNYYYVLYKGVYLCSKEATISERKIVNAFIELLEESSLEQISITDIIKKANLSRPTFYYYYSNKEDLVETTFSKILDKISSILQEDMTYQEGVVTEMLRYLKENQKLCLTLMTHFQTSMR